MNTLYIECHMGVAGDMLVSALLELLPNPQVFWDAMKQLKPLGITVAAEKKSSCGISGTHFRVHCHGEEEGHVAHDHHSHMSMSEIRNILERLPMSAWVKAQASQVYDQLAMAESQVHQCDIDHIHFHEVGSLDAIADIVGACLLFELLSPDQIKASPIHVGSGTVHCAHGVLPVPAPATALLLQGIPIYGGSIQGELCTPTGAAILRHFATSFGPLPPMSIEKIGYGMGSKEFPQANCVRVFLGNDIL